MALLFIDSFDHYNQAHVPAKWTSGGFWAMLTGQGRCGTNCAHLGFSTINKGLTLGSATCTVGFAMKIIDSLGTALVRFGTGGEHHVELSYNPSDGSLAMTTQKHPLNTDPELLGRTAPGVIQQNIWYFIEFQSAISHTAGTAVLRVNNIELLNVTGVDTVGDNSDNTPMLAEIRFVSFTGATNTNWYMDDLYILDSTGPAPWNTFLGDCRVEYLRPRAAGTHQEWSLTGAASHHQAVDDVATPDDDTSYVRANAAGLRDSYLYTPTGLPSGPIFGAQINLLTRKEESGPRILTPLLNGVEGASFAPSEGSYSYRHVPMQTNPATGTAWTISAINSAEFGVKVVS